MKKMFVVLITFVLFSSAVMASGSSEVKIDAAAAESWPNKTIEIVVPYKAGGDTDFHCRKLVEYIKPILGQSVIVTNMEGASGTMGMQDVMDSKPDGYRALYFHETMLTNKAAGITEFDHTDLDVCAATLIDESYVFVVDAATPFKSLKDFIQYAKSHPGELAYASSVSGYSYYLARILEEKAEIDLNICDAGGSGARNSALLSHKMQITGHVYGVLKPYIDSGQFRVLAALGAKRNPMFADIPTAREQGCDIVGGRAYFLSFPKGTPPKIIEKMAAAMEKVCNNPDFIAETQKAYMTTPSFTNTKELKKRLDKNLAELEANPSLLAP